MTHRPWLARELNTLRELWAAGLSLREIARQIGRTIPSIQNARVRFGIANRFHRRPEWVQKEVKRLYRRGRTDRDLAELIGCSRSTAKLARQSLGFKPGRTQAENGRRGWIVYRRNGYQYADQESRDMQRAAVAAQGWPAGCTPSIARVLDALMDGPQHIRKVFPIVGTGIRVVADHLRNALRSGWVVRNGALRSKHTTWSLSPAVAERRRIALAQRLAS